MGGIKNRDAKRAAAKVFSSAGGGGTKGPAVVDKRGQEQKCPHCDRVFKQSDRLKQHIDKQHADLAAAGGEAGPSGSASDSASAAAAAAAPANGGKPPPRPGSSGALAPAAAAATATAKAPARPGSSGSGSAAAAGAAGTSASGAAPGKVTMDVGARGGFFDEKSPKLLLQEWCTRNKRPKPRYVPQQGGGARRGGGGGGGGPPAGQWGCKVVLPDPKGVADRDVVVFLDASLAAADADEAAQRGAVAALHAVQGDRALDYVLPARYRLVWRELGDKAARREAQRAAAAEKAAQKRERQAARKAAADRRAAATVVMSEEQRRRIEALLRGLDGAIGAGLDDDGGSGDDDDEDYGDDGSDSDEEEELDPACRASADALTRQLQQLGFGERDAAAAVRALGDGVAAGVDTALPSALDWLCLSLPEERLPKAFAPGASSTISVVRTAQGGPSAARAAAAEQAAKARDAAEAAAAARDDPHVAALLAFGYPLDHAAAALEAAGGALAPAMASLFAALLPSGSADMAAALPALFATAGGGAAAAAKKSAAAAPSPPLPAAWQEEREALEAIYGAEAAFEAPGRAALSLDWPEARDRVVLHAWCAPAADGGPSYPDVPLAVGVTCAKLPPAARLLLTQRLAAEAARLAEGGHLAVHDLAVALSEALEEDGERLLAMGGRGSRSRAPAPYDRPFGDSGGGAADGKAAAASEPEQEQQQQKQQQQQSGPGPQASAPRRRPRAAGLSPEAAAAESARLLAEQQRLAVSVEMAWLASRCLVIRCIVSLGVPSSCRQQTNNTPSPPLSNRAS